MSAAQEEDDSPEKDEEQAEEVAGDAPAIDNNEKLNKKQIWNVSLLVLAFSCVVASLTLIVGTGALVLRSIGGSESIAPFSLACFFCGMALVSLTLTHWFFQRYGRKYGFWLGCAVAILGSIIGSFALYLESPPLALFADIFLGGGAGMGMYLRFAAVEVVPPSYASKAITWTLCGGCLAAFVGPETANAVSGKVGNGENLTYLGVYIAAAGFTLLQALFVGFVGFEQKPSNPATPKKEAEESQPEEEKENEEEKPGFFAILNQWDFILPLLVSILSWATMAMPMSIFRLPMREFGYSDRQSLTVIEFHFLAMYSPGFVSGIFIKRFGHVAACGVALVCFVIATIINVTVTDSTSATASWFLGLIFLGFGWNFGFSAATVWVTKVYQTRPDRKAKVQAANECLTFFFAGAFIFTTGYIYRNAGGGGLDGWKILNYAIFGLIGVLAVVEGFAIKINRDAEKKLTDPVKAMDRTQESADEQSHEQSV